MQVYLEMAWPPTTYDVIFRDHNNRFAPNLCQNVCKEYAYSNREPQVLTKNRLEKNFRKNAKVGGGGVRPRVKMLFHSYE